MSAADLPRLALSVRQPSAWAIIHGGKDIENRSEGSVRAGRMTTGRICIHAAIGLKAAEYDYLVYRMAQNGVTTPPPDQLVRRAIIGTVEVVDFVTRSDSPWYGGKVGLLLQNPVPVAPIPCAGELGYFEWEQEGEIATPLPWMTRWGRADDDGRTGDLFDDLPLGFKSPPKRPF
ncbi:MAG: hypothetical protein HRU30_01785 [Rhodobacteraceae bacterium]|nr:hypothetical protein [Paracoccaceae bacterium]